MHSIADSVRSSGALLPAGDRDRLRRRHSRTPLLVAATTAVASGVGSVVRGFGMGVKPRSMSPRTAACVANTSRSRSVAHRFGADGAMHLPLHFSKPESRANEDMPSAPPELRRMLAHGLVASSEDKRERFF